MKTLAEVKKEHILDALEHCKGNRKLTAKTLDISTRGLRNLLNLYAEDFNTSILIDEIDEMAQSEKFKQKEKEKDLTCKCFPTNEERINYLNTFPNMHS